MKGKTRDLIMLREAELREKWKHTETLRSQNENNLTVNTAP
jgi:hypothetical protein